MEPRGEGRGGPDRRTSFRRRQGFGLESQARFDHLEARDLEPD